jgi:hypothetical protein
MAAANDGAPINDQEWWRDTLQHAIIMQRVWLQLHARPDMDAESRLKQFTKPRKKLQIGADGIKAAWGLCIRPETVEKFQVSRIPHIHATAAPTVALPSLTDATVCLCVADRHLEGDGWQVEPALMDRGQTLQLVKALASRAADTRGQGGHSDICDRGLCRQAAVRRVRMAVDWLAWVAVAAAASVCLYVKASVSAGCDIAAIACITLAEVGGSVLFWNFAVVGVGVPSLRCCRELQQEVSNLQPYWRHEDRAPSSQCHPSRLHIRIAPACDEAGRRVCSPVLIWTSCLMGV